MTDTYTFVIRITNESGGAPCDNDKLYKVATQVNSVFGWGATTLHEMHPVAGNTIFFPPNEWYKNSSGQQLHDAGQRFNKIKDWLKDLYRGFNNGSFGAGVLCSSIPFNTAVNLTGTDKIPERFSSFFDGCWKFRKDNKIYTSSCATQKNNADFLRFHRNWMPTHPVYLNDFGQMRTPVYYPKSRI